MQAELWPEADVLFHRDPRWRGGDGASSVDLGDGLVLWLFGDSFVSNKHIEQRRGTRFVHNSIGIQQGYDPTTAEFRAYWSSKDGVPEAFFSSAADSWHWPAGAVLHQNKLYVFLMTVIKADTSMGFDVLGMKGLVVLNPRANPERWETQPVQLPSFEHRILFGAGGLLFHEGFLYSLAATVSKNHSAHLLRWPLEGLENEDLSQPAILAASNWVPLASIAKLPSPVLAKSQAEFSVHFDPQHQRYFQVQCEPFQSGWITLRAARQLAGPWSEPHEVLNPKAALGAAYDEFFYAGKAHPEQRCSGLALTCCNNVRDLGRVVDDETVYYPQFVRLTFVD